MSLRLFIPAAPASEEDRLTLERRANTSAAAVDAQQERQFVSFTLGGAPYALEATLVREALTRLGTVTPVAIPDAELGIAVAGNAPVIVVDLCRLFRASRSPDELSAAPALVLRLDEHSIAVAVEAPLAFTEGVLSHAADLAAPWQKVELSGRVASGPLVLSGDWLVRWVTERAGGVGHG